MSLSLIGRPQCKLCKVAAPFQWTKEDKAEHAVLLWTHNQNRDEAKGKREGSALRERERCHTGLHLLNRFAVELN